MEVGDRIVNYVTAPIKRFFAVWEIIEKNRHDPTYIFDYKEFPECVLVRPIVLLAPKDGIENPGVSIRRSAIQLSDEVGEKILTELKYRGPNLLDEPEADAEEESAAAAER